MTFSSPIMLWSLLGLAVPILIHFLSKKEGQVIPLGSIRHLEETSTQQFKGIKLNELLLLALRCALIFVFCLLLSGLRCAGISNQKWVVVEGKYENNPVAKSMVDSLEKEGYEQHFLCPGFPQAVDDNVSRPDYWMLVGQLREKNLASVVVLSANKLVNFKGKRIPLPSNVTWVEIPSHQIDFPVQAVKINADSIYVREGHSSAEQTFFTTRKMKSSAKQISISLPDSVRIVIVADEEFQYDRRIVMAALTTVQENFPVNMNMRESSSTAYSSKNGDWCIWLSDSKLPENDSMFTITMLPGSSNDLVEQTGPRRWNLTKRLNEEVALDKSLTLQLANLIIPSKKLLEIVRVKDVRTMPDSIAWSADKDQASVGAVTSEANRILIICLVVLLIIERVTAYQRNQ